VIGLPDMTKTLDGPVAPRQVTIDGFVYAQGDMGLTGRKGRPPVIAQGRTLRFFNKDAKNPRPRRRTAIPGRPRGTCRAGPTRTSAASIPSCGAPSA
jgi:hypothetical protein